MLAPEAAVDQPVYQHPQQPRQEKGGNAGPDEQFPGQLPVLGRGNAVFEGDAPHQRNRDERTKQHHLRLREVAEPLHLVGQREPGRNRKIGGRPVEACETERGQVEYDVGRVVAASEQQFKAGADNQQDNERNRCDCGIAVIPGQVLNRGVQQQQPANDELDRLREPEQVAANPEVEQAAAV